MNKKLPQHTPDMTKPGIFPWTKEERAYITRAVNDYQPMHDRIAELEEETFDKARKISALLEAVKDCIARLELCNDSCSPESKDLELINTLNTLIAQAEGRS